MKVLQEALTGLGSGLSRSVAETETSMDEVWKDLKKHNLCLLGLINIGQSKMRDNRYL